MEVLQTSALPLGDGADSSFWMGTGRPGRVYTQRRQREVRSVTYFIDRNLLTKHREASSKCHRQVSPPSSLQSPARWLAIRSSLAYQASEGWSGKRDSNPRLRP